MSRNKKPRKAYHPRPVTADTMALAVHHAAKPAAADRAQVLGVLAKAVQALREGVATEHQWSIAAGSVTVALAIERQGIVRGFREYLYTIEQALQTIYDRALHNGCGRWARVTLYFNEIEAINDLLWLHRHQVAHLGRAEFIAALDAAQKQTLAQGHTVTLAHNLERMAA